MDGMDAQDFHPAKMALIAVVEHIFLSIPASDFRRPVVSIYPDIAMEYLKVVPNPEDLGTILHDALMLNLTKKHIGLVSLEEIGRVLDSFRMRIQRVFDNSIRYNGQEAPYMVAISHHMHSFARSLWEEILIAPYYKEDDANIKALRLQRRHQRFGLVKRMPLNFFEYLEVTKILHQLLQHLSVNILITNTNQNLIVLRNLLAGLHSATSNSFCENPQNVSVTLMDFLLPIFRCLFPSVNPILFSRNDRKAVSKPQFSFEGVLDGVSEDLIHLNGQILQFLDEKIGFLLCMLTERYFRGCHNSAIYGRFIRLVWNRIPCSAKIDKSQSHYWVAAIIAENKRDDNQGGEKTQELSQTNLSRIPESILSSLKKLRPKTNNISGGGADGAADSISDFSSNANTNPNLCSLQSLSTSVGVGSSDQNQSVPGARGLQVPPGYAIVEYFQSHDFGWVKLDSSIPYLDHTNVDVNNLPYQNLSLHQSEYGKAYYPVPRGCDDEAIQEAQESKMWISGLNSRLVNQRDGIRYLPLSFDSPLFMGILPNRESHLLALPSLPDLIESIYVNPAIYQKFLKTVSPKLQQSLLGKPASSGKSTSDNGGGGAKGGKSGDKNQSQGMVPRPTVNFVDGKPKFSDVKMHGTIKDNQKKKRAIYATQVFSMWLHSIEKFTDNQEMYPVTVKMPSISANLPSSKSPETNFSNVHNSILNSIAAPLNQKNDVSGAKRKVEEDKLFIDFDGQDDDGNDGNGEKQRNGMPGLTLVASLKCCAGLSTRYFKGDGLIHLRNVDETAPVFTLENRRRSLRKECLQKELELIREQIKKLNVKPDPPQGKERQKSSKASGSSVSNSNSNSNGRGSDNSMAPSPRPLLPGRPSLLSGLAQGLGSARDASSNFMAAVAATHSTGRPSIMNTGGSSSSSNSNSNMGGTSAFSHSQSVLSSLAAVSSNHSSQLRGKVGLLAKLQKGKSNLAQSSSNLSLQRLEQDINDE